MYDIEIASVEISGRPTHVIPKVAVASGARVGREYGFDTGKLLIGTVNAGRLVDSTVNVKDASGTYTVEVAAVRLQGSPRRTIRADVKAGGTTQHIVDYAK